MLTTQLLSLVLRKIRQPRVIAEVIGGILLGMLFIPHLNTISNDPKVLLHLAVFRALSNTYSPPRRYPTSH